MKKKLFKITFKNTPVLKLFFESFTSWADSNSDGQGMLQNKQRHYHLHHWSKNWTEVEQKKQQSWTEEKQKWPLL